MATNPEKANELVRTSTTRKTSKRKLSIDRSTVNPKRRKSEDDKYMDIYECLIQNDVKPGDRLKFYKRNMKCFREARNKANRELLDARKLARLTLITSQQEARIEKIFADALILHDVYDGEIKICPEEVIKALDAGWKLAEKRHDMAWQELHNCAFLGHDLIYTAEKCKEGLPSIIEQLPNIYKRQELERSNRKDGKKSSTSKGKKTEMKTLTPLQHKMQNFIKELQNVSKDVSESCQIIEVTVLIALDILNKAGKWHDKSARQRNSSSRRSSEKRRKSSHSRRTSGTRRKSSVTRSSTRRKSSILNIPKEEIKEFRTILTEELDDQGKIENEYLNNIIQLEKEQSQYKEKRETDKTNANTERKNKIKEIRSLKDENYVAEPEAPQGVFEKVFGSFNSTKD